MEGKNIITMSGILVVIVVVLGQIQVGVDAEACCPNIHARNIYNTCAFFETPESRCVALSGCRIDGGNCPSGWTNDFLENTLSVNEYCKLGGVSSVCGAITTLQHSDASEVVNGAAEKCSDACSAFCTKGGAVETA